MNTSHKDDPKQDANKPDKATGGLILEHSSQCGIDIDYVLPDEDTIAHFKKHGIDLQ